MAASGKAESDNHSGSRQQGNQSGAGPRDKATGRDPMKPGSLPLFDKQEENDGKENVLHVRA